MLSKAEKLTTVPTRQGSPFYMNDLLNVITFSVPSSTIAHNIAKRDEMGVDASQKFRNEEMTATSPNDFWES